jgi:pilus assembly protein CpaB
MLKAKTALMLSVMLGIITTILFFQYTKQFSAEPATVTVPTIDIVVAKEKIGKNEKITSEKIEMIQMPEETVHPKAIKSLTEVEGMLATAMIEKGELILSHRIGSKKDESVYVSRKVKDEYRAVSVGVNFNQSVSNLIEPEDEVDVVFSKMVKDATNKDVPKTEIILKKTRVLAVGRKMQTPENTEEPYVEYSSVTLELKPDDAVKLINASEEGKIHFILNNRPVEQTEDVPSKEE